jgi:hypothetical protein
LRRGKLGEESGELFGGQGIALAVEVVNAHVAEVLDVGAELVRCGGHVVIVTAGDDAEAAPSRKAEA